MRVKPIGSTVTSQSLFFPVWQSSLHKVETHIASHVNRTCTHSWQAVPRTVASADHV